LSGDSACFGIYADRKVPPGADVVADHIDEAVTELLETPCGTDPAARGS
jgi:phage baseplate assembly protein W